MRKFAVVMLVLFAGSVFGLSSVAQRRAAARNRGGARAAEVIPTSPQIATEVGQLQWGMTHDQVVDYYRRAISARFAPMLRNKGQVEQDRLMSERDHEISTLRESYLQFNGAQNQRRWDTSFVGSEYTHNNGESMLVYEDPSTGNREFFFFFNDHLWKRFQARAVPPGSGLDFDGFVGRIEQLFGRGLHVPSPDHPERLLTVVWQDPATRLHLVDNSTFYNSFCLIYEDKATLARLADLRRNAPTKTQGPAGNRAALDEPQVGNADTDNNADIVDRITGKLRNPQQGSAPAPRTGTSNGAGGTDAGSGGTTETGGTQPSGSGGRESDPLRGL